jgi:hypothetical protein
LTNMPSYLNNELKGATTAKHCLHVFEQADSESQFQVYDLRS